MTKTNALIPGTVLIALLYYKTYNTDQETQSQLFSALAIITMLSLIKHLQNR